MNTTRILVTALPVVMVCIFADRCTAQCCNGHDVHCTTDLDLQALAIVGGLHPLECDLNGDGLVNFADRRVLVKVLRNTWMGDANLDMEFNSSDMVQVLAGEKYETGEIAGWAEGDWNGDTLFNSSDMVTALADGGYERGRPIVGDYNRNGLLDAGDLDLQAIEMVRGEHPASYDLNHDGRVDFADRQVWVCVLKNTYFGNVCLNGEPCTNGEVFVGEKYETGETAGWQEGDWNGDTLFDSSDMLLAFIGGCDGYEGGVRTNPALVPEPGSWVLLVLGVACLLIARHRA